MTNLKVLPERSDRSGIAEIQTQRLRQLLDCVAESNRFWQARFETVDVRSIRTLDDLPSLPLTTKAMLVDDHTQNPPFGSNLTDPVEGYTRMHQTSGTTGRPMRWLDTADSWNWFMDCWEMIYRLAGLNPSDRLFFPFSFGPFIGFWAAFEGAARLGNLRLAGGGMTTEARLATMIEMDATVICCTPTYALRMAEVAAAQKLDLQSSAIRLIIVAGEPGGSVPVIRDRIASLFDARVIDHWGMTEIGSLAVEPEINPGGLDVLETECIAEIIDPVTLQPAGSGETGELVITNLGRTGSPLIRYRTGDLVRSGAPTQGLELLRLEGGILGRADDMFTVRGNNVYPSSIEAILREFPQVAEFRVRVETRRAMHHVKIELEPSVDSDPESESLVDAVTLTLKNRLNFLAEVELVRPGVLPRFELKGKRFFREHHGSGD